MATATRTSVALPEIFSDGDMVLWLRKFELCAKANDWKDTDMLKRLPTLLLGKAFAIFERLAAETKEDFKKGDRETLLKQQFVEGVFIELKRQLLQRPTLAYEETVTAGQQLDLAGQISSSQSVNEVNTSGGTNQTVVESPLAMQLMQSVDILTRKPTAVFVKARLGDHERKCLVDTGATVSLVSREFISGPLKPCSLRARGIGGEDLHVLESTDLHVCLGMSKVSHQFLVVGMRNTCILGADFLKSGGMVVDIANSKLSWKTGEAELMVETTSPTVNKLSVLLESYSDIFVNGPSD
ncbi:Retrovirus-related Pol poly from transposon [Paramuricea clavata]|uniref:Retrovirus-related Pol poly from transposon n=1 Tax=Paramuricea clavata TaxID=317549 RepID=A0A6S7I5H2_PARCT|nr:Retrovirus-related Pol poly from transposon [Paramuricea clavata]